MACLAWALVSGGGAAWQPRAAATRMGRVWRGRIAYLRWGDEENTSAAERWQAATQMHDSGPRSTTGPSHLGESRSFAPAALRMTTLARFAKGEVEISHFCLRHAAACHPERARGTRASEGPA